MKKMKQHYCAHMWPNWHGASQQLSKTASAEPSGKWGCTLPSLDTPSGNLSSPSSEVDKFHPACVIWRFISTFFGTRLLGICLQQVWFLPLQGKMIFYGTSLISALEVASSTLMIEEVTASETFWYSFALFFWLGSVNNLWHWPLVTDIHVIRYDH